MFILPGDLFCLPLSMFQLRLCLPKVFLFSKFRFSLSSLLFTYLLPLGPYTWCPVTEYSPSKGTLRWKSPPHRIQSQNWSLPFTMLYKHHLLPHVHGHTGSVFGWGVWMSWLHDAVSAISWHASVLRKLHKNRFYYLVSVRKGLALGWVKSQMTPSDTSPSSGSPAPDTMQMYQYHLSPDERQRCLCQRLCLYLETMTTFFRPAQSVLHTQWWVQSI